MEPENTQNLQMRHGQLKVGDLVYYFPNDELDSEEWERHVALIIKVRRLLKTYDILLQTKNIIVKDVDLYSLQKIA